MSDRLAELRGVLEDLALELLKFDPSDDYHEGADFDARPYYAAIDRAVRLVRGEIRDWMDRG